MWAEHGGGGGKGVPSQPGKMGLLGFPLPLPTKVFWEIVETGRRTLVEQRILMPHTHTDTHTNTHRGISRDWIS